MLSFVTSVRLGVSVCVSFWVSVVEITLAIYANTMSTKPILLTILKAVMNSQIELKPRKHIKFITSCVKDSIVFN